MPLAAGSEKAYLKELYMFFLNRVPNEETLDKWVVYMKSPGVGPLGVAMAISRSPEAKGQAVIGLYKAVLNRVPSQTEVVNWRDSKYTIDEIREIFISSDEYLGSVIVVPPTPAPIPVPPVPPVPVTGKAPPL